MQREGRLLKADVIRIVKSATAVFSNNLLSLRNVDLEPNLLQLEEPVSIFGDLHGHFYDLLNILNTLNFVKDFK